jgi:hypothetical protein
MPKGLEVHQGMICMLMIPPRDGIVTAGTLARCGEVHSHPMHRQEGAVG